MLVMVSWHAGFVTTYAVTVGGEQVLKLLPESMLTHDLLVLCRF